MTPKRITNAAPGRWVMNEYSSIDSFSPDGSRLVLIDRDHFELCDGNGTPIKQLPLPADAEPKWIDTIPLAFCSGKDGLRNEIRVMDVRDLYVSTLRIFSQFKHIGGGGGESDIQGNTLVLAGDHQTIFTYNVYTGMCSEFVVWPKPFNALYLCADLSVLVCGYGAEGVQRLEAGTMRNLGKVAATLAHNDVCMYGGEPCLVRANAGDPDPLCQNGIEIVPLADPSRRRCIWPFGWSKLGGPQSAAFHISSTDFGWSLVSVYYPLNTEAGGIYKVQHDGSGAEFICHHHSVMMQNPDGSMAYNPSPKASVSRDGSRFVFASNGGDTSRGPNYCDTWLGLLAKPLEIIPELLPPPIVVVTPPPVNPLAAELAASQSKLSAIEHALKDVLATNAVLESKLVEAYRVIADMPQWDKVDFTYQVGREWEFGVLSSGLLQMRDVDALTGDSRPITTWREGNEYLFRAVRDPAGVEAFEMLTRQGNT